ncbi:hypothetical protein [Streptomyces acidiscabies]|uniref:hypothetical protein n=1 Tax=Streptomyces acidiscabies TaxID=42234 RepID=UPI000953565C|nr:hypothetical protein [Streptomyces acidiscabies]
MNRLVIAPNVRQAQLFIRFSGYNPRECRIATRLQDLLGLRLEGWETWFLQRMWPVRTHEDVQHMEDMMWTARTRGADIRRWWT